MQSSENFKISFLLFLLFLVFYTLQIPFYTSKPDVIVFAFRSLAESPILDVAYLNSSTFISGEPLPNYHLGHTLILWIIYQLFPQSLATTIWPSGFVSAISGALIVVLTFLIWKKLGLNNKKAIIISAIAGLIPSFVEESVIGEVYAIQFLFILLFFYTFLIDKWIWSTFFFLYACLISPLSGLAFGLIFINRRDKTTLVRAFAVGVIALTFYIIIYLAIGSNMMKLFAPSSQDPIGRGVIYRIIALIFFIVLNFNFLIIYLIKGLKFTYDNEKKNIIPLFMATTPQLLLLFAGSTFFIELGSFQLPLFWALAFPLGIYLSEINYKSKLLWLVIILSMALNHSLWIAPNNVVGSSREEAGIWLKNNGYNSLSIVAPWSVGISILKGRDGSSVDSLNTYYYDKPCPVNEDLLYTKKDKLIIAEAKKMPYRVALSKLDFTGLEINLYDPTEIITIGKTKKIFENQYVLLYEWANSENKSLVNQIN
jgi:hypothetical protein